MGSGSGGSFAPPLPAAGGAMGRLAPLLGAPVVLLGLTALLAPVLMQTPTGQRGLLALGFVGLFLFFTLRAPRVGVPLLLVYLALLGGVRRWLIPLFGTAESDPLLLVGPAVALFFLINQIVSRRFPCDTRLSRLLPWLLGLMFLQVFNPFQGGLMIGFAGILFYVVPVCWYYIGRYAGPPLLVRRLTSVVVIVALTSATYGMYQHFFGFLPSEQEWLRANAQRLAALNVRGVIRAFSFFTSPSEYAQFLGLGALMLWAAWLRGYRLALLPLPVLLVGLLLIGSRGPIVSLLAAGTALWAVQGRTLVSWLPRGALAVALAVVGLVWSLNQVQPGQFDQRTEAMLEHQVTGLLNPLDEKHSTASLHTNMFLGGIRDGFRSPLGRGLGATTVAAAKYSQGKQPTDGSTEVDLSNVFVSLGFAGGLLYGFVIVVILATALGHWRRTRSFEALAILGILLLTTGQWLNGGHYASALLVWFCLGALDRAVRAETPAAGSRSFAGTPGTLPPHQWRQRGGEYSLRSAPPPPQSPPQQS